MVRVQVVLGLSIPVLLAACDTPDAEVAQSGSARELSPGAPGEPQGSEAEAPLSDSGRLASGTLGPVRFEYDATQLMLAEVLVELPPDYADQVWAAKLIPVARARLLGQDRCRYGESGRTQTCNAESEAGLILALLERPLSDYRRAFVRKRMEDALSPARVDGTHGFSFTAQAEGSGIEFRFLALEERTVLVARQFVVGQNEGAEAINEVIRSIENEFGPSPPVEPPG